MREITLLVSDKYAETLGDALMDADVLSVVIEDADADTPDEQPLYGEPGMEPVQQAWKNSLLKVLINDDFDLSMTLTIACKALGIEEPKTVADVEVENADWVRITQAQFQPVKVSDRLWIVPTWHEPPAGDTAINIRLDPGVAFGTGSHPTTHLCLQWIDANVQNDQSVLDYGCGTGILAIAAKKVGAKEVLGTDIDPQAVEAAQINSEANDAPARFVLPEGMPEGQFDVVVANILSNPLKFLAPALLARVKEGGSLVLSGILARQAEEVIEVYRGHDPRVKLSVWKEQEGWVCIAGRRE
ncbi:MAG: 50S ribosomal protein L11 methyltransferase [Burkholderiaceae bacterium]|jgi:ribosomal protein L11 methyltransferase|nr:50S ribosomal protein L11 methyltransferase [Burkholderiaceae bacterium]